MFDITQARQIRQHSATIELLNRQLARLHRVAAMFDCQRCGTNVLGCSCHTCSHCQAPLRECECLLVDKGA